MISLLVLVACAPDTADDTGAPLAGPGLTHAPPAAVVEGSPLTFAVDAVDADGVGLVDLYHRTRGDLTWGHDPMVPGEGDGWSVTLEGEDVRAPGIEYYFKAVDASSVATTAYLPKSYSDSPFDVEVYVDGEPFPYLATFDPDAGQTSLQQLGWGAASLAFTGYGWELAANQAHSAPNSAFHSRGIDGIGSLDDWLVSPPIDLSSAAAVRVSWYEFGVTTSEARHGLYVSTGSRDPADGDYRPVVEALPAPTEEQWTRSAQVSADDLAGAPVAYFAWRYQGETADDWYVDDIRIGAAAADLTVALAASPSPIGPGDDGDLVVTVNNASDIAAAGVSVAVSFPDAGAVVDEASVSVGDVVTTADATFTLHVDDTATDNLRIPVHVVVTSTDGDFAFDDALLIGEASTATVDWTAVKAGQLSLTLGVGDPDAPTWSTEVYSATYSGGSASFAVDVTDQHDLLPPSPTSRWWVRAESEQAGALDAFTITFDGELYAATVLPAPAAGEEAYCWLPEPPELVVSSLRTSPSTLSPGVVDVGLGFTLQNVGADTAGPVSATLTTADPDLVVHDGGPVALTAGVLTGGGSAYPYGVFSFDVAGTHTDSTPLYATLTLDDGVESWTEDVALAVPWPVIAVNSIDIDDDGGDGLLDPDESAELRIEIANAGGLGTDGSLDCTLAQSGSSTAVVTLTDAMQRFSALSVGETDTADGFLVDVTGGAAGDALDFTLSCADRTQVYVGAFTLDLGEPPWTRITTEGDPVGDQLGAGPDVVGGSYRVVGDSLEVRVQFADAVDAGDLFVEAWGESVAGGFMYYMLGYTYGTASLRGYDESGFTNLASPAASFPSSDTLQLDLSIASMDLTLDEVRFGFGAGWCGPPDYYCDHWPDGWGYPYDSESGFSTSGWYELSW